MHSISLLLFIFLPAVFLQVISIRILGKCLLSYRQSIIFERSKPSPRVAKLVPGVAFGLEIEDQLKAGLNKISVFFTILFFRKITGRMAVLIFKSACKFGWAIEANCVGDFRNSASSFFQ
jgi:hypothetical protein